MSSLDKYSRTVEIPHFVFAVALILGSTSVLTISPAFAVPKGPAGQTCKSSGTTTVNGKEEGTGKAINARQIFANTMNVKRAVPTLDRCLSQPVPIRR
jgi:hypothetical protein